MGEIVVGVKVINGAAKMQANFQKATPQDMSMAISYLEMLKQKILERFSKSRTQFER